MSELPLDDPEALLAALQGQPARAGSPAALETQESQESQESQETTNGHKPEIEPTEEFVPHPAETARSESRIASKSTGRVPPMDLAAEELVLGAMMLGADHARALFDIVSIEDFYTDAHRLIAEVVLDLLRHDSPTDPLAVYRAMAPWVRERIGGAAYLTVLAGAVPVAASAPYHATAVAELSARRQLIDAMSTAAQEAYDSVALNKIVADLAGHIDIVARAQEPGIRLLSISDLRALPAPVDLIEGVVSRNVLATLWGPSGHGKSLLALDLGLSVALGRSWCGRAVQQGPVVMVVAEGVAGTQLRIDAWLADRGEAEPDNFFVVAEAVNLFKEDDPQAFVRAVDRFGVKPALVVFDTLARSMVGGEENSARDMGIVIEAADWIRSRSSATALVVHHSGRNQEHERGSTALFGASDSVISAIKDEDGAIVVESRKQKDRLDFERLTFGIRAVDNSIVLVDNLVPNDSEAPPRSATSVLASLWQSFGTKPVSSTSWLDVSDVPKRTFHRAKKWLVDHGFVTESGTDKRPIYTISDRGEQLMVP